MSELLTAMGKCTDVALVDLWLSSNILGLISNYIISEALSKFRIQTNLDKWSLHFERTTNSTYY